MVSLTAPVGGAVANPNRGEVVAVQQLLNKHRVVPSRPIAEDGIAGPATRAAIKEFQRRVVKMSAPDGRVDPNGATLRALNGASVAPVKGPGAGTGAAVSLLFRHQSKTPTGVTGLKGAEIKTTATRYESLVTVSGGVTGSFKGSIYPDNMNIKGRLKDGTYDLSLGFHHPGTPKVEDLVVRTNDFRAALIVQSNGSVPVTSNLASKQTSVTIHVHNGFNTWTAAHAMSEGCLILAPGDWSAFLTLFLKAYPSLADWTAGGGRLGKKIGTVSVSS